MHANVKKRHEKRILPEPLYVQRTPFYEYGSQLENQLFEAELKGIAEESAKTLCFELSENRNKKWVYDNLAKNSKKSRCEPAQSSKQKIFRKQKTPHISF